MKNKHLHLSLILTLSLLCNGVLHAQIPSVKSVSPDHGYPGQVIDIKGFDFEAGSRVFFGSVEGTVVNSSNQLIQAVVPSGGSFENISVLNPSTGLSAFSNDRFYVAYGGTKGINPTNFDAQADFAAESGLFDLCICDLNGDQLNDIIGANTKNTKATILRNFSTPTNLSFSKTPIELGATTLNATCADLNGDGKPEVILTQADNGNRVFLLENFSTLASIAFIIKTITITGATVNNVVVNDLDLDGKPDLIVTDQSKNSVYLVKNSSTGGSLSFSSSITTLTVTGATSTSGIDVQDINGDKRPDIVTSQFLTDNGGVFLATNNSTAGT
ncbi:MAG: FG-GAP-like repeat-containing protein, partial [Fulvivirga sp.]